jgi:hypothetical protein
MWHHDNSGLNWSDRGDYTYYRNYFSNPLWTMWGTSTSNPASDGNRYLTRQVNEWKGGKRIQILGSIYDTSYNSVAPTGQTISLASQTIGTTDVDFRYNTIEHVAGGISVINYPNTPAIARYRIANNLFWDINGNKYHDICVQGNCGFSGQGWVFEGPETMEDLTIDHNTVVANVGNVPAMFWLFNSHDEGVSITNNFFSIDGGFQGAGRDGGVPGQDSCTGLRAKALMDCMFTPSYVFSNNVLVGNGATQSQIQGWYSGLSNSVPNITSLSNVGWFNCQGSSCAGSASDFHLKANYCSGCGARAADLADVGADMDTLLSMQGNVVLIGTPASSITSTAASVAFLAPDSAGCPVDYSSTDSTLLNNFNRVNDPGGNRVRNITLSGLASRTTYYYRVNCAVQQPTGQFRTN